METSGYSGGFVAGPSPVPNADESAPPLSPLDAAWQPPVSFEAQAPPVPFPGPQPGLIAPSIPLVPVDDISPVEAAAMFGLPESVATPLPEPVAIMATAPAAPVWEEPVVETLAAPVSLGTVTIADT